MMLLRDAPRAAHVRGIERGTPDYPAGFGELPDPPRAVYVRGCWPLALERTVAIVGARSATPYGRTLANRLAHDLAARGVVVVSGLAHGIDAAAHEGALSAGGVSVGVLASGVRQVTPPDHESLAARLCKRGAVLAEREDGPPFGRGAFVKRNRLIAALAHATIVVEASERSGALSTAAAARGLGRLVFAVPGDVDRPASRGTLGLLRKGARVCADAGDVLPHLPVGAAARDPESRLLAALEAAPLSLDVLAQRTGLEAPDALARLLELQWAGLAVSQPGGRWSVRT